MQIKLKKSYLVVLLIFIAPVLFSVVYAYSAMFFFQKSDYQKPYLEFLEKVYNEMDINYYQPVSRKTYEEFKAKYKKKILPRVKGKSEIDPQIKHLGAGLLVNKLKSPDDTFTNFIPPKIAVEYKKEIYSYEYGLGIEGKSINNVFLIEHVQKRSEAFEKGIRPGNILLGINNTPLKDLSEEDIHNSLYPPLDTVVSLQVAFVEEKKVKNFDITCKEYFVETIEEVQTTITGLHYFKIKTFNKETANDLKDLMEQYGPNNIEYLILDLRGNPGGPPLAVRELCGIFLPPGLKLFYYEKKNTQPFGLSTPVSDIHYKGRIAVIVDKKSGSSSELLAGTLKGYNRAIVLGKEPTAGFAFLKGKIDFDDGSMLALVTGKTFRFDGEFFGPEGVLPNFRIPDDVENVEQYVIKQITQ